VRVSWGPVPWTIKPLPVLLSADGAFLWLEWIRSRTLDELTADAPPPEPTAAHPVPGV